MRHIVSMLTVMVMLGATSLVAQEPQCNNIAFPGATQACNTAVDAVRAFYPLAGMIVSGGNPVLGSGGALGGFGHLMLTARVNGIKAALPDPTAATQSPVPTSFNGVVPAPMVDAALGIGYGARVGVLKGGFPIPSVSVSWMHRSIPRLRYGTLGSAPGTGDQFEFTMDLSSDSYRAVAGWKFVLVDLAAGVGVDRYKSDNTNIRFYDSPTTTRTVVINPTNTRALVFVNGGLSLAAVKLVGEIGLQAGKDQSYFTQFSGFDPKAAHVFGGVGVRFGF